MMIEKREMSKRQFQSCHVRAQMFRDQYRSFADFISSAVVRVVQAQSLHGLHLY